jgi:hypothetical protein
MNFAAGVLVVVVPLTALVIWVLYGLYKLEMQDRSERRRRSSETPSVPHSSANFKSRQKRENSGRRRTGLTMQRRGFLKSLLGASAAMTLDPERLLWVPGTKLISLPKPVTIYPAGTNDAMVFHYENGRRYLYYATAILP